MFILTFEAYSLALPNSTILQILEHNTRPEMRHFSKTMDLLKEEFKEAIFDTDGIDDLYDLYYNATDLKLLLDLLASKSGISPCLKLLGMLDKYLQEITKVSQVKTEEVVERNCTNVIVTFDDSPVVKQVLSKLVINRSDLQCIYSVEIFPEISTVSKYFH